MKTPSSAVSYRTPVRFFISELFFATYSISTRLFSELMAVPRPFSSWMYGYDCVLIRGLSNGHFMQYDCVFNFLSSFLLGFNDNVIV